MVDPHYMPLLQQWADYIADNTPDYDGEQLTTDDYLGVRCYSNLAHW